MLFNFIIKYGCWVRLDDDDMCHRDVVAIVRTWAVTPVVVETQVSLEGSYRSDFQTLLRPPT